MKFTGKIVASDLALALSALGDVDTGWLQIVDGRTAALHAVENGLGQVSGRDSPLPWRTPLPAEPLLLLHPGDEESRRAIRRWFGRFYPLDHQVQLLRPSANSASDVQGVTIRSLADESSGGPILAIFVPPVAEVENVRTFAGIMNLTRTLRAPGGCPWDREQTHDSLKPHLLEEAYEVLDALDTGDPRTIAEEMGDLLYQITIHAQVASENGSYTIEDVIEGIMRKLIGRHPHVFENLQLDSAQDVRHAWESFKQAEKPRRSSIFEGIPRGLPALPQSNLMQKRAASVGFEWPALNEVIMKVREELDELQREVAAGSRSQQREELGDLFFVLVSVARHLKLDPEESLRLANGKFAARFREVEAAVKSSGKTIRELSPAELDAYWQQAKNHSE